MASIGNALVSKILGHSAAEKAFRPWWDNLEDFLVYGLVMLGIVVAPTAIINGTPLDCTICKNNTCTFMRDDEGFTEESFRETYRVTKDDPAPNAWWIKKYCTATSVDSFIMYFPFILLLMALVMVLIERGFIRMFKAGMKLDAFYNLLVKEGELPDKDVEVVTATKDAEKFTVDIEDSRSTIEVSHSFSSSDNYFLSYVVRTVSEFVVATALLVWLCGYGIPQINKDKFIKCDVYGIWYECAGHAQQYYLYVLIIAILILIVYLICSVYNLLWLALPQLGELSRIMRRYRNELRKQRGKDTLISDEELLGELYNVYYNNRDLKLLLDLLATSSGIAASLRIMALFDKDLRIKTEPGDLKISLINEPGGVEENTESEKVYDVAVQFTDAVAMKEIFSQVKKVASIYTVEITPPTSRSSIKAVKMGQSYSDVVKGEGGIGNTGPGVEMQPLTTIHQASSHGNKDVPMKVTLYDLDPSKEYVIRVCTIVNGKTISRRIERIKPKKPKN